MKETVASGTATALEWLWLYGGRQDRFYEYGANGTEGTHSWFVGFSNVDDPDLVVAVIAEGTEVPEARQRFRLPRQYFRHITVSSRVRHPKELKSAHFFLAGQERVILSAVIFTNSQRGQGELQ